MKYDGVCRAALLPFALPGSANDDMLSRKPLTNHRLAKQTVKGLTCGEAGLRKLQACLIDPYVSILRGQDDKWTK